MKTQYAVALAVAAGIGTRVPSRFRAFMPRPSQKLTSSRSMKSSTKKPTKNLLRRLRRRTRLWADSIWPEAERLPHSRENRRSV